MTLRAVGLFVVAVDRHHARSSGGNVWLVVHRRQLHACLVIDFTLSDVRTIQYVIVIVQSHQTVLLLAYLLLLEIGAALALVAFHLLPQIVDATWILH